MGKKSSWFSSAKKALSPAPKEKKDQKSPQTKKRWFGKQKKPDAVSPPEQHVTVAVPAPTQPAEETTNFTVVESQQQDEHGYNVSVATAAAAEAAVAAAQAAAEVVRLTSVPRYAGKSKEEIAAIKIQTTFRGYLARRALRALRGLVRLKSLIEGQSVKRQATTTLRCMQTLARLQSQIRSRRIRMSEENQALQKQLQLKHEKELEKLRMDEEWDDSVQSKEQIEASLQSKQEAALRRERALAYAYSHQQMKKNSRSANPTFMDPSNPQWGWSWLERWMAARPWETRSMNLAEKDFNDHGSVKSAVSRSFSVAGDNKPSPGSQRPGRRPSHSRTPSTSSVFGRTKPASPRVNGWVADDDVKSMISVQSERNRRHSIAGSSARDDESLASSPSVPSFMVPTQSAKAKNKLPSPLGAVVDKNGTAEKVPMGSAKKRLAFPASPGPRRHSVPGKIESTPAKHVAVRPEGPISNGGDT